MLFTDYLLEDTVSDSNATTDHMRKKTKPTTVTDSYLDRKSPLPTALAARNANQVSVTRNKDSIGRVLPSSLKR